MKRFIVLILFALAIFSCQKDEIDTFKGDTYFSFAGNIMKDSTTFSFFFHPNENEYQIPVPIKLCGNLLKEDMKLSFSVNELNSDAYPENYSIPKDFTFKAGVVVDTMYITVKNTADLKDKEYTLVVNIDEKENYKLGEYNHRFFKLKLSDIAGKPEWWDYTITKSYLGKYSNIKYQLFIMVTGESDLSNKTSSELRALALQFKYYIQEQKDKGGQLYDEDGDEITVTVIG